MDRSFAASARARAANDLVEALQARFVAALSAVQARFEPVDFAETAWLRDGGAHGGGSRFGTGGGAVFDRASVNVSHVHYDDRPDVPLASATALSTIVHPRHPRAPSFHAHLSWTETKAGAGGWRLMADLNPALPDPADTARFVAALDAAAGPHAAQARAQGDRYFWIPALGRHRGVAHAHLEGLGTGDDAADLAFARRFGEIVLDGYAAILGDAPRTAPGDAERAAQLAYHTLYVLQVLTLDRGTTSGLLVHDQNDVGILGSLPSRVDPGLLRSWRDRLPHPQELLLDALIAALPPGDPAAIDDAAKRRLAAACRAHYRAHPEGLALQAGGEPVPLAAALHGR